MDRVIAEISNSQMIGVHFSEGSTDTIRALAEAIKANAEAVSAVAACLRGEGQGPGSIIGITPPSVWADDTPDEFEKRMREGARFYEKNQSDEEVEEAFRRILEDDDA